MSDVSTPSPEEQADEVVQQFWTRRRRLGFGMGLAIAVSALSGPVWVDGSGGQSTATACTPITAGRAGTLPCERDNSPTDDLIEKIIGTTATGCVVGFVSTGFNPVGLGWGCVGGLVGNIAW
jgi:hypothetical protein